MTDQGLLEDIATGDRGALASLYERYSKPLHDFARRTVRDPEAAADVVQNTFVKIWGSLQTNPAPEHAKAWIYTIARNEAINEVRRSARAKPIAEADDDGFVQLDVAAEQSPEDALIDKEMARLVWSAASALNANAYALLDMHLRQNLTLDEIGAATGSSSQNVYKNMSRMRESLEEAVADVLLRRDHGECDQLDAIVAGFEHAGDLTATERRAISKHVRSCDSCSESRKRVTAPAAMFARLAPLPLTPELAGRMFDKIEKSVDTGTSPISTGSGLPKTPMLVGGALVAAIVAFIVISGSGSAPVDPADATSPTHEVGVESELATINVQWSAVDSDGFSVLWDDKPGSLPDTTVDLAGEATDATSPRLDRGTFYFHLRTQRGDQWTSTIHLGPFVIVASTPATTTTTSTVAPTSSTSTTTTTPSADEPDLAGEYSYRLEYLPSGECGYPAFTDQVTVTLNADGTASLSQAQHVSAGTWSYENGRLVIELVLDSEFPETYSLTSSDNGATVSGQSTYQDGDACVTTYEVTSTR